MKKYNIIKKYAIILSIFYAIQLGLHFFSNILLVDSESLIVKKTLLYSGVAVILNVLTALILLRDIKKYNLKIGYLVLATIIYRPIGVCLFLIGMMIKEEDKVKVVR